MINGMSAEVAASRLTRRILDPKDIGRSVGRLRLNPQALGLARFIGRFVFDENVNFGSIIGVLLICSGGLFPYS